MYTPLLTIDEYMSGNELFEELIISEFTKPTK